MKNLRTVRLSAYVLVYLSYRMKQDLPLGNLTFF